MRRERKQYNKRERKSNGSANCSNMASSSSMDTITNSSTSFACSSIPQTPNGADLSMLSNGGETSNNKCAINSKQHTSTSSSASASTLSPSQTLKTINETLNDEYKHQLNEFLEKLVLNEANIESKLEQELELNGLLKRIVQLTATSSNITINITSSTSSPSSSNAISHSTQATIKDLKQLIVDYIGKECIVLIRWAKTIQNYQTLDLNDQAHLIESNFMEILLLNFIWRTCIYNNHDLNVIYLNKQFKLTKYLCRELELRNIFDSIIQICKNLIQLKVNLKEYLCLKTIVLLKSGNYY